MDERALRALFRATQPILQRTAPIPSRSRVKITPVVLDQVGWGVVLAYLANVSDRPPEAIPRAARSGEGPLGDEEVSAALAGLKGAAVEPRLRPRGASLARFAGAVQRLLESYGWTPARSAQAAEELAQALPAVRPS